MQDSFEAMMRRLDATERNQSDLARTVTKLVEKHDETQKLINELQIDRAARQERDKHHLERFDRIENGIEALTRGIDARWKTLQRPLWAAATAVLTTAAGLITISILKGGLSVVP